MIGSFSDQNQSKEKEKPRQLLHICGLGQAKISFEVAAADSDQHLLIVYVLNILKKKQKKNNLKLGSLWAAFSDHIKGVRPEWKREHADLSLRHL